MPGHAAPWRCRCCSQASNSPGSMEANTPGSPRAGRTSSNAPSLRQELHYGKSFTCDTQLPVREAGPWLPHGRPPAGGLDQPTQLSLGRHNRLSREAQQVSRAVNVRSSAERLGCGPFCPLGLRDRGIPCTEALELVCGRRAPNGFRLCAWLLPRAPATRRPRRCTTGLTA
jgi:hypothetical protein